MGREGTMSPFMPFLALHLPSRRLRRGILTCSLAHLEMLRNPIFFSPFFQANDWYFGSRPQGHLSTHQSKAGPGAPWGRVLSDGGGL